MIIKSPLFKRIIKNGAKWLSNYLTPKFIDRLKEVSIWHHKYFKLSDTEVFNTKEELWHDIFQHHEHKEIILLEFGVFEGYSIKYFSTLNTNSESSFIGFDSFKGLPEDWHTIWPKSKFDLKGALPHSEDKRISFVEGWFQNTVPNYLASITKTENLIVHFDADLYSSTLFCLMQLYSLKTDYYAIFDEFMAGEISALENFQQATGSKVEFIGKTIYQGLPMQVSCKISTPSLYEV